MREREFSHPAAIATDDDDEKKKKGEGMLIGYNKMWYKEIKGGRGP